MARAAACAMLAVSALFRLVGFMTEPWLTDDEIHRVAGEPFRFDRSTRPSGALKVVTWNIERGVRFEEILETLRALAPDLILLQEVDQGCRRSGGRDVARRLADALSMNWVSAGEFQEIGEGLNGAPALTGQAILSTTRIDDPAVIVFREQAQWRWRLNPSQPRRGGRIALRARIAGSLVYNVHVESGGNTALRQRQLEDVLADQARAATGAVIIGGDFNNTVAGRLAILDAMKAARFAHPPGTDQRQTSIRHRQPIDWIFHKGIGRAEGHIEHAANISDHYPVVATLTRSD
jgi:endonuclease/exonuclease/phosphatase family metal-dependent hydrolase